MQGDEGVEKPAARSDGGFGRQASPSQTDVAVEWPREVVMDQQPVLKAATKSR